ncbi:sulfatase-modifying factor enzyme 1 [Tamilnaduibacter salinus]|uniref:Sulfatase-modifying factor enzyme 1 n=1 Tax=Tamilnaduibacter salinus TaxID=1484056 RepID=A0A2U1CWD8_9GAMM|nr:SUMF1/EgtB/PvdO family nonheme iron enzyme [Tamilnaduibacter salinus]PVY76001.1 sulfatase-modifying factor enzyme 1 [Tamilnaduibacter salinus]
MNRRQTRLAGLAVTLIVAGCSSSTSGPTPERVNGIAEKALDNMVFVEGGTFMLGDVGVLNGKPYTTFNSENNKPPVEVTLDSYSISKHETTWEEFVVYLRDVGRAQRYTLENGYSMAYKLPMTSNKDPLSPNYYRKPARSPNYGEAEGYCAWLANQTGVAFALPTEAQWEFAARNRGKNVPYATNDGTKRNDPYLRRPKEHVDPSIPPSGNMLSHSSLKPERRPVGSYPPSPIGLYDMSGNVAEWTQDWYDENAYQHIDPHNPQGPGEPVNPEKPEKVVRDWAGRGDHVGGGGTVFVRGGAPMSASNGFRCVVNQPEPIDG